MDVFRQLHFVLIFFILLLLVTMIIMMGMMMMMMMMMLMMMLVVVVVMMLVVVVMMLLGYCMGQPRELHGIARNFYVPRRTRFFLVSTLTVDSKWDVWNSNDLDLGWFALQKKSATLERKGFFRSSCAAGHFIRTLSPKSLVELTNKDIMGFNLVTQKFFATEICDRKPMCGRFNLGADDFLING